MVAPMTFRKQERIVSRQLIETLFEKGDSQSLAAYPLRAIYTQTERRPECAETQILISVPKKRFKHAVDRNKVKRQVREAYRKNRHLLSGHIGEGKQLLIAFVWLSDKHSTTTEVEKRVVSLLHKIASKV
ncbi:MAG: ribonuclease P protein component [Prevotella sp.]|nr:ribonuclease P protein component [Prevotella sp.]